MSCWSLLVELRKYVSLKQQHSLTWRPKVRLVYYLVADIVNVIPSVIVFCLRIVIFGYCYCCVAVDVDVTQMDNSYLCSQCCCTVTATTLVFPFQAIVIASLLYIYTLDWDLNTKVVAVFKCERKRVYLEECSWKRHFEALKSTQWWHESDENITTRLAFVTCVSVTVAVTHSLSGCKVYHAPSCYHFVWQLNMIRSSL